MIALSTGQWWGAVIWLYLTIALITGISYELAKDYNAMVRNNTRPPMRSDRVGDFCVYALLWPVILIIYFFIGVGAAWRALRSSSINKEALAENARLREEVESLKDRLYELEP
jgi:hypothetical protein